MNIKSILEASKIPCGSNVRVILHTGEQFNDVLIANGDPYVSLMGRGLIHAADVKRVFIPDILKWAGTLNFSEKDKEQVW